MTHLEFHNLINEIGMSVNNIAGGKANTEEVITALAIVGMNICCNSDIWEKDELTLSEYAQFMQEIFEKTTLEKVNDYDSSQNSPRRNSEPFLN